MKQQVLALQESLTQISGCKKSSIVSVASGLVKFSAGEMPPELRHVVFDEVVQELARIFTSNLDDPYGDNLSRPTKVDFVHIRLTRKTSLLGIRLTDDHFWAILLDNFAATDEAIPMIQSYAKKVANNYKGLLE